MLTVKLAEKWVDGGPVERLGVFVLLLAHIATQAVLWAFAFYLAWNHGVVTLAPRVLVPATKLAAFAIASAFALRLVMQRFHDAVLDVEPLDDVASGGSDLTDGDEEGLRGDGEEDIDDAMPRVATTDPANPPPVLTGTPSLPA